MVLKKEWGGGGAGTTDLDIEEPGARRGKVPKRGSAKDPRGVKPCVEATGTVRSWDAKKRQGDDHGSKHHRRKLRHTMTSGGHQPSTWGGG